MKQLYLVQRGTFKPNHKDFNCLYGQVGKIELDYMGSAEFEWGAIPASYIKILVAYRDGKIKSKTLPIRNPNGVPLNIVYNSDELTPEEIETELMRFLESDNSHLKEHISFKEHYTEKPYFSWREKIGEDNFWWDIRSDVMFFFGAQDRVDAVMSSVKYACDNHLKTMNDATIKDFLKNHR